jgi:hypothetical protein
MREIDRYIIFEMERLGWYFGVKKQYSKKKKILYRTDNKFLEDEGKDYSHYN